MGHEDGSPEHCKEGEGESLCRTADSSWNLPRTIVHDSFGPWFGMNTKKGVYEAIGSGNTKSAYTALHDVGMAIANLASLPPSEVPDHVRIEYLLERGRRPHDCPLREQNRGQGS